jgi:tRNA1(Val) A37 N6-methylase TrmN6
VRTSGFIRESLLARQGGVFASPTQLGSIVYPRRMEMAADELTSDALTASFRLTQRRHGHRFSVDDLATAWEAVRAAPGAASVLDMGCGVGSVLLMVAWRLPTARVAGIEAQEISFELARRNVRENGLVERVTLVHGDLRDVTRDWRYGPCDLVTGTPPYLPLGTASASPDPQRAAARIELRGGVEDYLAAAARVLSPEGVVVVCSDGRAPERVIRSAAAACLSPVRRVDIVPRAGRGTLFSVWTCARASRGAIEHVEVVMRDEEGQRTESSRDMRRAFGLS